MLVFALCKIWQNHLQKNPKNNHIDKLIQAYYDAIFFNDNEQIEIVF